MPGTSGKRPWPAGLPARSTTGAAGVSPGIPVRPGYQEAAPVPLYPFIEWEAQQEVKVRIMAELLDGEIPDPQDAMIISLADARGIFPELQRARQLEKAVPRIELMRNLEALSRGGSPGKAGSGRGAVRSARRSGRCLPPNRRWRPPDRQVNAGPSARVVKNCHGYRAASGVARSFS